MAIRKVLLPSQAAVTTEAAFRTAVLVTRMWDAHLVVLHVATDRTQESHMRALFEKLAVEHGLVMADPRPNTGMPTASFAALIGREAEIVAHQARLADVVVVAHPASNKEVSSSAALHAVLFDSAKPILIAPQTAPSTIGQRICIGWNGTAESASAVLSAMPWLHRALSIRILWSDDYHRRGPLAPELETYLGAHDLQADQVEFRPVNNIVGEGLLAAAKEFDCDLLVMGAYSHSRLRQLILGGVTHHVLGHATIPLLMHR